MFYFLSDEPVDSSYQGARQGCCGGKSCRLWRFSWLAHTVRYAARQPTRT